MSVKTYILAVCGHIPQAWRKGQIVAAVLIGGFFGLAVWVGWSLEAYPTAWALVFTAAVALLDILIVVPYSLWGKQQAEIETLKEFARPKIELVEILRREKETLHGKIISYELSIKNAGVGELGNCLAKIDKLEALDGTRPNNSDLPLAIRTAASTEQDRESRFYLRGGEVKRIPLCSRNTDKQIGIDFNYETKHPNYEYSLRDTRDLRVTVGIYGAPSPCVIVVRLTVDKDNILNATREVFYAPADVSGI